MQCDTLIKWTQQKQAFQGQHYIFKDGQLCRPILLTTKVTSLGGGMVGHLSPKSYGFNPLLISKSFAVIWFWNTRKKKRKKITGGTNELKMYMLFLPLSCCIRAWGKAGPLAIVVMCQCSVTNIIEDFVDLNEDLQMYIGKGIENYERVSISSMTVMTVFSIKTLLKKIHYYFQCLVR